jgi:hypothetical protein
MCHRYAIEQCLKCVHMDAAVFIGRTDQRNIHAAEIKVSCSIVLNREHNIGSYGMRKRLKAKKITAKGKKYIYNYVRHGGEVMNA